MKFTGLVVDPGHKIHGTVIASTTDVLDTVERQSFDVSSYDQPQSAGSIRRRRYHLEKLAVSPDVRYNIWLESGVSIYDMHVIVVAMSALLASHNPLACRERPE
jgi:hypothetical protein